MIKKLRGIFLIVLMITGIMVPTTVFAATSSYVKNTKVVTTSVVQLKKTASTKSKSIVKIKKGEKVTVVAKSGKTWTKVKTYKGRIGYVKTNQLKKYVAPYKGVKKTAKITYYCACPDCNGYWASWRSGCWSTTTSSGKRLYNQSSYKHKYCAATPSVGRLGQTVTVYLDGAWRKLKIVDRMGSSYGSRIDVFYPSHSGCYAHGVHWGKTVYIK